MGELTQLAGRKDEVTVAFDATVEVHRHNRRETHSRLLVEID